MNSPLKSEINTENPPRILVAPLDWGLGHATRCIPVIRQLQQAGAEVWLAGEGAQKMLLRNEFPELPFLDLPGYRIKYSKSGVILPITSPVNDKLRLNTFAKGKTAAGCENVNGILKDRLGCADVQVYG